MSKQTVIVEAVPSPKELSACTKEAIAELSRFIAMLHGQFAMQFPHDIHTNIPSRLVSREGLSQHTLQSALVSAIGEYYEWDPDLMTLVAAKILEDCNEHDRAAVVYGWVPDEVRAA